MTDQFFLRRDCYCHHPVATAFHIIWDRTAYLALEDRRAADAFNRGGWIRCTQLCKLVGSLSTHLWFFKSCTLFCDAS